MKMSFSENIPKASRKKFSDSRTKLMSHGFWGGQDYDTKKPLKLNVATYNARSLSTEEKIMEMESELSKIKWDIVGVSEVKQRGESLKKLKSGHLFYQVGSETETTGGVGFFIHRKHEENIIQIKNVSTRVAFLTVKLSERYFLKVVQVYAPTSDHADREVEDFYDDITLALNDTKTHYNILIGDFNAKMGKRTDDTETSLGKFGLGNRNERGETLLSFLLEKNLFQMNSFFYKKDHRRWTWRSPDGKTKNEIDFMITDKKQIFRNVTVLNQFSTGSDHRMLKASIETDLGKERYRMTKKKPRCTWTDPRSINTFEEHINTILENKKGADQNVNTLNNIIIEAIEESQKIHCQEKSNNKRLSPETQALMEERRKMQSDKSKEHHQLREINKKISKSIRKDNRKHKTEQIQQTIEENKSLKVLRRRLTNGKKEIIKLKNKDRTVTTNREELLRIVEEFYTELYRSRQNHKEKQTEKLDKSEKIVINQGSEEMPSISTDEIRNALKKMKKKQSSGRR